MAKTSSPAPSQPKSLRRRAELRRRLVPSVGLLNWAVRPEMITGLAVMAMFIIVTSALVVWSREQVKVTDGQIMKDTRVRRTSFDLVDDLRTKEARDRARERSAAIYVQNAAHLGSLRLPLMNLPVVAASVQGDFGKVDPQIVRQFALEASSLPGLAAHAREGKPSSQWATWVDRLLTRSLPSRPMISRSDWQRGLNRPVLPQLRTAEGTAVGTSWHSAVQIPENESEQALSTVESVIVREAGIPPELSRHVAARLLWNWQPTFVLDEAATKEEADRAVAAVEPIKQHFAAGEIIYRAGDRLTSEQYQDLRHEHDQYRANVPTAELWSTRAGVIGLIGIVAVLMAGYVASFYPRIVSNALRAVALTAMLGAMLALSAVVVVQGPNFIYAAALAPTLVVAIIALLAYDQRLALFLAAVQSMFVVLALDRGAGFFILLFAGCATMIALLREVRHRHSLIRASMLTAVVLGAGALMVELAGMPLVSGAWRQLVGHTLWAAGASVGTGFFILGILPSVERLFDITTGMTLAELRDPRQPLLKQLQQKAPGTYTHSLQAANIAEAAAEAIGADGLLTYVGGLYHDIGKMNKPEYFIENRSGGVSKHDKLSPAMSLLVIVGHVKDGIELAREIGLPRQIIHFIESHHGTTLVEYFYHAARTRAGDGAEVDEIEFRYPGPKPRTREAAILMLSDAVESAARTLGEPTPARIEALVRELSRKRMRDGQFDQCDLTFRDLTTIEDSIIKSVCALYHSRISYPTSEQDSQPSAEPHQAAASA